MMRVSSAVVVLLGIVVVAAARGQADNEAQVILDKALKAHFPKGKTDKKHAYIGKNKGTIHAGGLKLDFTQQVWVQPSGKFKEVLDMTVMDKAVKVSTVFDGKKGWIKVNDMDITVSDEILDEFKQIGYWMGLAQLTGFKNKGIKLSLLGEVQVNGRANLGVKVSKEGKKDIDFYFDKKTGLMSKTERRTRDLMTGQEVTEERLITEYQDTNDRKVARRVTVNRDGKKLLDVEVLEVELLDNIDDGEFAAP
ncbi:MAG: hypothetical protein FJ271_05245 [Planctomycetes bacterium]|nr:hypothetical protein [Planctomycetota bacterium]